MIKAQNLSKKFGKKTAVDNLSFQIETGKVTGFLGPNGAGKSTTMRLMLGLDNGKGATTYDGKALQSYGYPSQIVGILLEAKAFHPTRTARRHLSVLTTAGNIPGSRVDEVLDMVGLKEVANDKPGKFSLGMSQRLGIAAAILGKPKYLILDEPGNGLDPEGIAWLRQFLRDYAKEDHGVFISSHLLSEMALLADNVVVVGKGRLISDTSIDKLIAGAGSSVFVRATNLEAMQAALKKADLKFEKDGKGLAVTGTRTDEIGKLAHEADITILELAARTASLEEAFLELTEGAAEYEAHTEKAGKK
ncbi:MAG TPA: ATP-binding cassette domain-containing protein [Candidatus Saccharimonadales bacterium]|nr:ATP-binding cassette domain-containing protein [Candidatus Saccharimonadales bacterium]